MEDLRAISLHTHSMKRVHGELTPPLTAPNSRKRKRSASGNGDSPGRPHPQPTPQSSAKKLSTSLYDHISHILLEQDALREFNKRDRLIPRPPPPSPGSGPSSVPQRREEVSADLQRFARTGGPSLDDLRGYTAPTQITLAEPQHSSSEARRMSPKRKSDAQGETESNSKKSKTSRAYDANFETMLRTRDIKLPGWDTSRPANFDELVAVMKRPASKPIDQGILNSQYEKIFRSIEQGTSEDKVKTNVFTKIRGDDDEKYPNAMNKLCTGWARLFPDVELFRAKPDYLEGLPSDSGTRLLRQQLKPYVAPLEDGPCLPNFFLELKGPVGTIECAKRQALYDGTLGARGMLCARRAATDREFDNIAQTFSGIYASDNLRLYAHWVTQPQGVNSDYHYHMCTLGQYIITTSAEDFQTAVMAFRNLRDHAAQLRTSIANVVERKYRLMEKDKSIPPPLIAPVQSVQEKADPE